MTGKKRAATTPTAEEKTSLTNGFKLHWFQATLSFVKDDNRQNLKYPTISHAQAEYICSLIRPDSVKKMADTNPQYVALYEALTIFGLKFEFKLHLLGKKNGRCLLLTKICKKDQKAEDQPLATPTIESTVNVFRRPKKLDKLTNTYMLATTRLIMDFICDKTRATLEIRNAKPLECLFSQLVSTSTRPLFPEHSILLSHLRGQDFYLKVNIDKTKNNKKSALRNVTFTKVPKFDTEPKIATTSGKSASKIDRLSKNEESQPNVSKTTKSLDTTSTLEKKNSYNSSNKLVVKTVDADSSNAEVKSVTKTSQTAVPTQMCLSDTSSSSASGDLSIPKSDLPYIYKAVEDLIYICRILARPKKKISNQVTLNKVNVSTSSSSKSALNDVPKSMQSNCYSSVASRTLFSHSSCTLLDIASVSNSEISKVLTNAVNSENVDSVPIDLAESQNVTPNLKSLKGKYSISTQNLKPVSNIDFGCSNSVSTTTNLEPNSSASFTENLKSVFSETDSSITENPQTNNSTAVNNFINNRLYFSRNLVSPKSSSCPDLESIFKSTVDTEIAPERTTRKSNLSRSLSDLRLKIQNRGVARTTSNLDNELACEDVLENVNQACDVSTPCSMELRHTLSHNSLLESCKGSNLPRTMSVPTLTSLRKKYMCKSKNVTPRRTVKMLGSNKMGTVTFTASNIPQSTITTSTSQKAIADSSLHNGRTSRVSMSKESDRSSMESTFKSSLTSSRSASVLEGTREVSPSLETRLQFAEKFGMFQKQSRIDNKSKVRRKGRASSSVAIPRKTQLMEAMSVPIHNEKSARIMKMMGYQGGPLGVRGDGITEPIMPTLDLVNGAGFGYGKSTPKKDTNKPIQMSTTNKSGVNDIPSQFPVNAMNPKPKYKYTKSDFREQLLKSAVQLMTTEVTSVKVPFHNGPKKIRSFMKFLLRNLNEGSRIELGQPEEVKLLEVLSAAMKESPWKIDATVSSDRIYTILKKIPESTYEFMTAQKKPKETKIVPKYISVKAESKNNYVNENNMYILTITDHRLQLCENSVSHLKLMDYPVPVTDVAFRLIVFEEIRNFSKMGNPSMTIHFQVFLKDSYREFLYNLSSIKPHFDTEIEKDAYENILNTLSQQNLFLEMVYIKKLIVHKLTDTPENRTMVRNRYEGRLRKKKNNSNNYKDVASNNSENIKKYISLCNTNTARNYTVDHNDNLQTQITNDVKCININQTTDKKEDNVANVIVTTESTAITSKTNVINSDSLEKIDIVKDNVIKNCNGTDKEDESLKTEDDDDLIDKAEIVLLPDEESVTSGNPSTGDNEIKSIASDEKVVIKEELKTDQEHVEITKNTVNTYSNTKNSNPLYSDLEFVKDLNDMERVINDHDDKTEVFIEQEANTDTSITRKRSRTYSEPINDSKKPKANTCDFKTVTVVSKSNEENTINQELVLKIQTIILDAIDNSNELPLLKCHGIIDGGLVYSCHDENSYLFMEKCLDVSDFKIVHRVAVEDKFYRLRIRLNSLLENVTRLFKNLELYNVGINTEDWRVTDVLKGSDHTDILIEIDGDSFKYIRESDFSLYAGVDMARFSVNWD